MSDETQNDPWADDATASAPADADGIDWTNLDEGGGDEFDDILDGLDVEETESGEVIHVRDDSVRKYVDPHEVGLKDGMWVPVRILTSEVQEKHVPRLSSKTCVAKKDGKVVGILYDQVEAALRNGAEEVIGEFPLPYFVCTANHVAPRFGERRFDWEIEVPVFTIKTALYKTQRNRTGYQNDNGRSLRTATGATTAGDTVSKANMHEVADKMVDTIVMARVSVVQSKKPKFRERLDADGNSIMVQVDPESGDFITVFRQDENSDYVIEPSGEIWEGDESDLVAIEPNRYAIRDSGEFAAPLTEQYYPWNDYIKAPFLPLPERKVQVERVKSNGDEPVYDEGEITLDTIGAVARGNTPGAHVDIMLHTGEDVGKVITATWLGTGWVEKPAPKEGEDSGTEVFVGDNEQEKALASM